MSVITVFFPILAGLGLGFIKGKTSYKWYSMVTMLITLGLIVSNNTLYFGTSIVWFEFLYDNQLSFHTDEVARLFSYLIGGIWILVLVYAFSYMNHSCEQKKFFAAYLFSLGGLLGVTYAGDLISLYLFFEWMTLGGYLLITHERSHIAMLAGRKYLYYSLFGASLGLIGIIYLSNGIGDLSFVPGGIKELEVMNPQIIVGITAFVVVGFGCKAGIFPLQSWLAAAHPVAPAPASAILSGLITKGGIIAILRWLYYVVGPDLIRGTWVQEFLLALSLITIFLGSMLALREKQIKRRLAYSSVSQLSYVIFGLLLLSEVGVIGAMLQVVFHALAKNLLFLAAGAIIFQTHKFHVEDYIGMGGQMPKTFALFTIGGLSLVGIPLTGGFVSKWYLANGSMEYSNITWGILAVGVIMISAVLTAGYLLMVSSKAYIVRKEEVQVAKEEIPKQMILPMTILAGLIFLFGIYTAPLLQWIQQITDQIWA